MGHLVVSIVTVPKGLDKIANIDSAYVFNMIVEHVYLLSTYC